MKHCLFNKVKHVHQCNLKPIAAIQHSIIVIIEPYSVVDPDLSSSVAQLSVCSRGTSTVMGWPDSINPEF